MMNKLLILLFTLLPIFCFGQKEIFTSSFISLDNENQFNIRTYQGYSTDLDSVMKKDSLYNYVKMYVGLANGLRYYKINLDDPTYFFNEAKIYFKLKAIRKLNFQFNPSMVISPNLKTILYESNCSYQYSKFYFEISSERDLVGARALSNNLISNYHGVSIDYSPIKRLTFVGGFQFNHITDDNNRWFYLSRVIYTLPNEKMYFDFRTKDMRGGKWSDLYFSPEKISQSQIGFGLSDNLFTNKIGYKTYIATGLQTIDNQTMYLFSFDFKLNTHIFNKLYTETDFGIRNFNTYVYGFGNLKLKYTF